MNWKHFCNFLKPDMNELKPNPATPSASHSSLRSPPLRSSSSPPSSPNNIQPCNFKND